ncbi:expressed unknown protein [Seminavis robusta]|uniref:Uncharacterized protein n=1 Tax=Seminavis robusta TaxID=568900 RepID=A0A9N8DX68_9STRA|nr:expressed unknown protein [Seminavis robusta]|eukprot:Sro313_g114910.1 n/a (404) ;mRNA; f:55500-56711
MSHDDEEEVVEEVADDEKVKPRRRMPRRVASTDGGIVTSKARRPVRRAASGDGSKSPTGAPPMRRTATDGSTSKQRRKPKKPTENQIPATSNTDSASEEEEDMEEPPGPAGMTVSENRGRARRMPARSKSTDGTSSRALPSRSKSGTLSGRSTPKRTASGFGLPRRTKSSDGTTNSFGLRKGKKKGSSRQVAKDGVMNIFGSDIVSTEKVLEDIEKTMEAPELVRLELEDMFMADREDPEAIPLALKELLEQDDRPWECVEFMDDIMDGSMFIDFRERKKHFMKVFAGVCEARLIPCTYKAKITLSSGSLDMDQMVELLFYLRSERSVNELTIKSEEVDEGIIRALTDLFKADKRKWNSVTLQLSGSGPGKPGSPEHTAWAKAMQKATVAMQKVAKERGINLG